MKQLVSLRQTANLFGSLLILFRIALPASAAALPAEIEKVLQDKMLSKATVGIDVVRLGKHATDTVPVYSFNPTTPLVPASNLKVITTSAALQQLGLDFKFRTLLLAHGPDLILVGDGDPTLGDAELFKKVGWNVDTVFKTWAAGLAKRGLAGARDLLIDDSVFDDEFVHPNWPGDQYLKHYQAEVAGLNLNVNCIDFYVRPSSAGGTAYSTDPSTNYVTVRNNCVPGNENAVWLTRKPTANDLTLAGKSREANDVPVQITIHDPPMYAGTVLAETLKSAGIALQGGVKRDRTARTAYAKASASEDKSWMILAVHETPLSSVIARANKDSLNLYAECLCKRLGFAASGSGTWQSGTTAVAQFLSSLNIPSDQYKLDDGCGLSKQNTISTHLMVTVLSHDFYSNNSAAWLSTLSVAGEDGTLLERFKGTDLRGRVIAKTGFVNGVSCLSGYLHAKDGAWYCFSIMFNGIPDLSNTGAKTLQERIVRAIDQHESTLAQAGAN